MIVGKVKPYIYEAISFGVGPDGTLDTGFATDNEVNHLLTSNAIPSNQWHFVVMTYDGAFVRFYIDGIVANSYPRIGTVRTNTNDLAIGRHGGDNGNGATDGFFNGIIDELRIYDRALTDAEVTALYQQSDAPNLDMTNASCRYVAPIYNKMWQAMKVKKAPSCGAVLRYHTWVNFTRRQNYTVTDYYSNRLNNIDTDNQLFNKNMEDIDKAVEIIGDVIDPDLRRTLSPANYQLTYNVIKSKGIIKSLASGASPFKRSTVMGKVLDKTLKEKIGAEVGSDVMCKLLFDDKAVEKSCANEAKKVGECVAGVATEGWKAVPKCVVKETTSLVGIMKNWLDVFDVVSINQHLNGYLLINDYLNAYYEKATIQIPTDEVRLESDIQAFADKLQLSNGSFLTFDDYDMQFVKDGIREGILRTAVTGNNNVKLVESLRKILKP